ncbi:MAG: hypothetical protein ACRCXX_13815 [Cetobacterium sp.]|uniref:hypothetical protein n=1 Tax=Cetobacterium sp. TaxID=2071632 RepID=UPI003F377440
MIDVIDYEENEKCKFLLENIINGIILIGGHSNAAAIMKKYISELALTIKPSNFKWVKGDKFDELFGPVKLRMHLDEFPIISFNVFDNKFETFEKLSKRYNLEGTILPVTLLLLNGETHVLSGITKPNVIKDLMIKSEVAVDWLGDGNAT